MMKTGMKNEPTEPPYTWVGLNNFYWKKLSHIGTKKKSEQIAGEPVSVTDPFHDVLHC